MVQDVGSTSSHNPLKVTSDTSLINPIGSTTSLVHSNSSFPEYSHCFSLGHVPFLNQSLAPKVCDNLIGQASGDEV